MSPAEIIVLRLVKVGICTNDLFRASRLDTNEPFMVVGV